jgi:hypothetical protein
MAAKGVTSARDMFILASSRALNMRSLCNRGRGLPVMKVTPSGGPKGPGDSRKAAKRSGGASFADSLREVGGVEAPSGVAEKGGVAGVDGILAAQAVSDPDTEAERRRQRQMARGEDLLDRLDELRLGILTGRFPKEKLAELAQRLRQKREQGVDLALDTILAEIELRAEVEIAKYTRRT